MPSVFITNATDTLCWVCRNGGGAGCWSVVAGAQAVGPYNVQRDRDFWLERAEDGSLNLGRHYSVTEDTEFYTIYRPINNPSAINLQYDGNGLVDQPNFVDHFQGKDPFADSGDAAKKK